MLALAHPRYGYKRITALLKRSGWKLNRKRVLRIWRQEGLKVPIRSAKKSRLWLENGRSRVFRRAPQPRLGLRLYLRAHRGRPAAKDP